MDDALLDLGVIDESGSSVSEARMRIAELRNRYGLSDSEIAKATDADPRTVARWRSQSGPQRASRYDKPIEQLLEIIDALEPLVEDPKAIRDFLRGRNRYLDGARPINLLGAGRYAEVREAITRRRGNDPIKRKKATPASRSAQPTDGDQLDRGRNSRGNARRQPTSA